ncbi:hypothetical protein IEN85_02170 [Pelagicoccus sp. NFK12]|uniref:CBM6 domain-containing protein n=1 Tax=Pelagicoccus enzymogenes TaxID=2773457 RepID=A0A927F4L5_9BACT|nr:Ig-like domain-containing protein [Pelagicoccus enzymogenes]MBD5778298.1 hypothetical protein [Pelagicoccus enzymogenes]
MPPKLSLLCKAALCCLFLVQSLAYQAHAAPHQLEKLDRGLVAVKANANQVYLSWRLLVSDSPGTAFNVYRSADGGPAIKLTSTPLLQTTDFKDSTADLAASNAYSVRAVVDGVELAPSRKATIEADAPVQQYLSLPLQVPADGVTADGVNYSYSANDLSVGDLDGDGDYEVVVKWYPSNARDNAQSGYTGNTLLDAYTLEGELLWRIDLGVNIRSGSHYTQFMVYDLDGDGKAEVACRTAEGSMDASGAYVADANKWFGGAMPPIDHAADRRNSGGYILEGPEFLTLFDGLSGLEMASTLYEPQRVPGTFFPTSAEIDALWGDGYGNRVDRFLAAVAYLDGERPSLVMCRGYYTRTVLAAYDWRDGALTKRWVFDTLDEGTPDTYRGQGAHSLTVGDVDGDGKDEIVYGAATIDDNGSGLYTTGIGHGDALHFSDMDPDRPGLEVWMPHESPSSYGPNGSELHDAATGEVIFGVSGSGSDVGRGVAADIDPRFRGFETWASRGGMHSVKGEPIETSSLPSMNFLVWWDGDLLRELLSNVSITKWNWETGEADPLFSDTGILSNNSTKATPNLSGDILGDWREEVIWRNTDSTELRIYTTTIPAECRMVTLMHDRQYRLAIAWQNVGYNQPPHPGFYLGDGMIPPVSPEFYYAESNELPQVSLVAPSSNTVVSIGDDVPLVAEASDSDGFVESVQFFESGKFWGMDLSEPYTALWDATEGGTFELRAVATDDAGEQGVSLPVAVVVAFNDAYDVSSAEPGTAPFGNSESGYTGDGYFELSHPSHDVRFTDFDGGLEGGTKTLLIRYSKQKPGVKPIKVWVNGVRYGLKLPSTGSASSWEEFAFSVELAPGETNELVFESLGGEIYFDKVTALGIVRNQAPAVTLTSPKDGFSNLEGIDLYLSALAKDIGGSVEKVEFFVNGTLVGSAESEPYAFIWQEVGEGAYEIVATATDNLGDATSTDAVHVLVNNPPLVAIVEPNEVAYTLVAESTPIVVEADDGVGSVELVELLMDGALLDSSAGPAYEFDWVPDSAGPRAFQAVATDNRGTTAASSPIMVNVLPAGYEAVSQAEDVGLSGDAVVANSLSGYNGTGYVELPSEAGRIELKQVDGGSGSMALVRIRYANTSSDSRVAILSVNSASYPVEFAPTGGSFVVLDLPVPVDAGKSNALLLSAIGEGALAIDEFKVRGLQSLNDHTYHAENALASASMVVESSNSGFNGTAYMNFPGSDGLLEFPTVDGGLGGTKTLSIRYALGSGAREGRLTVNGVSRPINFVASGSFTTYVYMDIDVDLNPGNANSILIESIGNDLANVDEIVVRGVGTPSAVPDVALLTPTDPSIEWRWGETMTMTASASIDSGSIERVEYYAMDPLVKVGEATIAPYSFDWFVLPGEYEILARAYSGNGSVAESYGYLMDVSFDNDRPTVEITSPAVGTVLLDGADVTIEATASDPDGSVAQVEFYVDGSLVGVDAEEPFSHTLTSLPAGGYQVKVRAVDNLGSTSFVDVLELGVYYATGGELRQEAEDGILAGAYVTNYDSRLPGPVGVPNAVKSLSSSGSDSNDLPGTDYLEMRFNIPVRGYYRIKSSVASPDGSSDSMYVSIDGADPFQHRWVTAISSGFATDYVRSDRQDPLLILWEQGGHYVRFGHREPLELDYFEVELVSEAPLAQPFYPTGGELRQEAEDAILAGNFTVVAEADASGGFAVQTGGTLSPTPNYAEFRFNVEHPGIYALKAGVKTVTFAGQDDSLYVSIDGASSSQHTWDTEEADYYIEDYVASRTAGDPLLIFLYPGGHSVRFGDREGPYLDWVELEYQGDGL